MTDKLVVVFSGRKSSGKDTIARLLREGPFVTRTHDTRPFAGPLKEFCVNVLGLNPECVYGTDEQKNQPTHLLWERAPNYFLEAKRKFAEGKAPRTGFMSHREVMQWWGTEVVRYHDPEAWTRAWEDQVRRSDAELVFCTDCRFPNEVGAAHQAGGFVVRLLRAPYREDEHESEKALDDFPLSGFDLVVDNRRQSPTETMREVLAALRLFRPDVVPPILTYKVPTTKQKVTSE